jgi:hypothetical protein
VKEVSPGFAYIYRRKGGFFHNFTTTRHSLAGRLGAEYVLLKFLLPGVKERKMGYRR